MRYVEPRRTRSEDETPKVHFAAGTKDKNNQAPANLDKKDESRRDHHQEKKDQQEYAERKKDVRHKVHDGAGAFELDGCDDRQVSNATDETKALPEATMGASLTSDELNRDKVSTEGDRSYQTLSSAAPHATMALSGWHGDVPRCYGSCNALLLQYAPSNSRGSTQESFLFYETACTQQIPKDLANMAEDCDKEINETASSTQYGMIIDSSGSNAFPFPNPAHPNQRQQRQQRGSQSSNKSSPFTTPDAQLLSDDHPLEPSQFPCPSRWANKSIFDSSLENQRAFENDAHPQRHKILSNLRRSAQSDTNVLIREDDESLLPRQSSNSAPQYLRPDGTLPPAEDAAPLLKARQRSASALKQKYQESMRAYHHDRRSSDSKAVISRLTTPLHQSVGIDDDNDGMLYTGTAAAGAVAMGISLTTPPRRHKFFDSPEHTKRRPLLRTPTPPSPNSGKCTDFLPSRGSSTCASPRKTPLAETSTSKSPQGYSRASLCEVSAEPHVNDSMSPRTHQTADVTTANEERPLQPLVASSSSTLASFMTDPEELMIGGVVGHLEDMPTLLERIEHEGSGAGAGKEGTTAQALNKSTSEKSEGQPRDVDSDATPQSSEACGRTESPAPEPRHPSKRRRRTKQIGVDSLYWTDPNATWYGW